MMKQWQQLGRIWSAMYDRSIERAKIARTALEAHCSHLLTLKCVVITEEAEAGARGWIDSTSSSIKRSAHQRRGIPNAKQLAFSEIESEAEEPFIAQYI